METFIGSLVLLLVGGLAFAAWHEPKIYAVVAPLMALGAILGSIWAIGFDHGLDRASSLAADVKTRAEFVKAVEGAKVYEWYDLSGIALFICLLGLGLVAKLRYDIKREDANEADAAKARSKKDGHSTFGLLPKDNSDFGP